jgi:hypothetical protein
MPTAKSEKKPKIKNKAHLLADRLEIPRLQSGYALPYYTRQGIDTEFLISNPNMGVVTGTLIVFGRECRVVEKLRFDLGPNCTQSFFIRPIVPDHAGHVILVASLPVIPHTLYHLEEQVVVGSALADRDNLFRWSPDEKARTYGFGYRALPLGAGTLDGSVFVSNPNSTTLTGLIAFFDQRCELAERKEIAIEPGCTEEYPFPQGRYGYGRIQVSNQAAINVLHFVRDGRSLAAAELLGEANRLEGPPEPPKPGTKILFDDTHGCRPGLIGDWTDYEAALTGAGYTVAHYNAATVTLADLQNYDVFVISMARSYYSNAEKQAISDFANGGGGVMVVQDFGNAPWTLPTRDILNMFGANDDNNIVTDPTNNDGNPGWVIFDYQRNFLPHPITNGWKSFRVDAVCSLSGGGGWTTIVETDDDSTPVRRPVVLGRGFGSGRVLAFGDSNTWANHLLGAYENQLFGIRCAEWLLFQI